MSASRVLAMIRKDLALGPRSPILMYAVAMPVIITLLLQGVFGNLFERPPRLGIVDLGASELTAAAVALDGLRVTLVTDADELQRRVAAFDLDAGLVLPAGFDDALRSGARPPLTFYVAGESLASDRVILAVTTIDLLRAVEGRRGLVDVEIVAPVLSLADDTVAGSAALANLHLRRSPDTAPGCCPSASFRTATGSSRRASTERSGSGTSRMLRPPRRRRA